MKRNRLSLLAPAVLGGLATAAAPAAANVEVGGTAGVHVFNDDNELGVPDTPRANSMRNSALFGLRLGYYLNDMLGVEAEVGVVPTESRTLVFDIWNLTYRAHLIAQFRAEKPENKLIPFVLAGGGLWTVAKSDIESTIGKDTDEALYAGVGAKYRVDNGWGLRFDGRILFPPSSASDFVTTDFEALLSVYKEWGRKEAVKPAEVIEEVKDTDGDGLKDDVDSCPTEPEDMDAFEDDNGCPDPDNDGDGVPDVGDAAPNDPEDKDNWQDEDGAPEADNDADGILDAADAAPNDPEDKDGFEDENGAPDLDNDADGVADATDTCNLPAKPGDDAAKLMESRNGYQDTDGCNDDIPKAVQKFSGVIAGINFKSGSSEILKTSNKVLDAAVKVLLEFPEVKLEIQGHTDDQKPGKGSKFADNTALSQARADAVKAYIVGKGVAADRLTSVGFGESKPVADGTSKAARAKNRRVEFKLMSGLTE